ncbi:MAG: hypothetical protein HQ519_07965 [Planctomycetes bacterium]|nr:hypothetical protein [Planctomycetota bacterium]
MFNSPSAASDLEVSNRAQHLVNTSQDQTSVDHSVRYIEAAVNDELRTLAATKPGDRANATFKAAAALGRFVGAGALSFEDIADQLTAAAIATGLPHKEAEGHVLHGLQRGAATPADIPASNGFTSTPSRARYIPKAKPTQPVALRRPPIQEVQALWEGAQPVTQDILASNWLESRELSPAATEDWDLARALPNGMCLPRWARTKCGTWLETNHRVVFGLFDANGRMASCKARCVLSPALPVKSLAPTGFQVAGLVLADPLGRQLLAGANLSWWQHPSVVISEGEPDWLTWASRHPEGDAQGWAYFGIESGAWSQDLANRLPDGTRVSIRTHNDQAGDRYSDVIAQTLVGRCELSRVVLGGNSHVA